jgi:quercetin dioxygenase-like cupin family protein
MKNRSLFLSLVTLALCSSASLVRTQTPLASTYTQTVTREVFASGSPQTEGDRILELVRYTIPAGANLPIHYHPGMQIERVELGTLTYFVVKGSVQIVRADGTQETLNAGQTTLLKVGDSLAEPEGMIHYGKNETASPVILLGASLFASKQPKAILVKP